MDAKDVLINVDSISERYDVPLQVGRLISVLVLMAREDIGTLDKGDSRQWAIDHGYIISDGHGNFRVTPFGAEAIADRIAQERNKRD